MRWGRRDSLTSHHSLRSHAFTIAGKCRRQFIVAVRFVALIALAGACGGDQTAPKPALEIGSITIDSGPMLLERGTHKTLTATVRDSRGTVITVPLVWRSSDEKVAVFERDKRLLARDTGLTLVVATSLGVISQPVPMQVVWRGPAKVAASNWTAPAAVSPAAVVNDSIRVLVTNRDGQPVPNARVAFAVSGGNGAVSPAIDTTNAAGIAAARWKTGPGIGANALTAVVIGDDDLPLPWVTDNPVHWSVDAYQAFTLVDGDAQSALLLAALPNAPRVQLVDRSGKPRAGAPVTFTVTGGGRVAQPNVSTDANGVATSGTWTLGDAPGDQTLVAHIESAAITLHATATGTAVHYPATAIAAGALISCALSVASAAECWGEQPKVGDGGVANRAKPTAITGGLRYTTVTAGPTHNCAVAVDASLYCWGINALADTTGQNVHSPTPQRVQSNVAWQRAATGLAHTCALATDGVPYCWGDGSVGQIGNGALDVHYAPTLVAGGFHFTQLAAGTHHTCGLTASGLAFCWGRNQGGALGDGTNVNRAAPTAVVGGLVFKAVSAGADWTCGITTAGRLHCWGIIPLRAAPQLSPTQIGSSSTNYLSLSVGGAHACALTENGIAHCWGDNTYGQLGDSSTTARNEPTAVNGEWRFSAIAAGSTHTCGLLTSGTVACWGLNRAGEEGEDVITVRLAPRRLITEVRP